MRKFSLFLALLSVFPVYAHASGDARRLAALGMSPPLAVEVSKQINSDISQNIGSVWSAKWEKMVLNAGATTILTDRENNLPGNFEVINMAFSGGGKNIDQLRLDFYVDGETTPSVSYNYGMIGTYGLGGINSPPVMCNSNIYALGCTFRVNVPYTKTLTIKATNGGAASLSLWGWMQGNEGGQVFRDRYSKLHTVTIGSQYAQTTVQPLQEYTLLDADGRGAFYGMQFFLDRHNNVAGGDGNCIEGNFRYYLDGHTTPDYESSGTEDYFGSSFNFNGIKPQNWDFGVVYAVGNTSGGGTSVADSVSLAYRFHIDDPVFFNKHIKVTWQCGDVDSGMSYNTPAGISANLMYYTDK